jgi:predicted nuclease of predicted toxin-antitoxin system
MVASRIMRATKDLERQRFPPAQLLVTVSPPKIIWLRAGNAGTPAIEGLIRREQPRILTLELNADESLLVLSLGDSAA